MLSCESAYIALTACTQQRQWFAQLLRHMRHNNYISHNTKMVHILVDNMGASTLKKQPQFNGPSKHFNIYYHFMHNLARNRHLQVSYVPMDDMVADRMTKPLQSIALKDSRIILVMLDKWRDVPYVGIK
jgi:hypothetical protein